MFVSTIMITFVMILMTIVSMAVGYILNKKPIQGTCGGLANYQKLTAEDKVVCQSCGKSWDVTDMDYIAKSSSSQPCQMSHRSRADDEARVGEDADESR